MRRTRWMMVAWLAAVLSAPAIVHADGDRLAKEIEGVARGFPFAGQAKGGVGSDRRGGGYAVDGAPGATDYPANDEKPPHIVFSVKWWLGDTDRRPKSATELDQQFADAKRGFPKGAVEGTYGQHTWSATILERGTMDPNMSGDPYMATADGAAYTECASMRVQVGIAIYSHGSHGARNRPEVLEAMKKAAEAHHRNIFGQLLALLRYGCAGDAPPPEEPAATLRAERSCDTVRLVRGKLPSEECGIYVKGWPPNRVVSTCFPGVVDAWGRHPNGIVATFVNEMFHVGAVVAKGRASDEYYLPIWWYAQCQAVPGVHDVEVVVYEGEPSGTLGSCPAATNRAVVHFQIEVLAEMSGNCTPRPPDAPPLGGGTGSGPGMGGTGGGSGTGSGGASGGTSTGGSGVGVVGRWRTTFGDLVLTDAGNGTVRGTLGDGGVVVIGKVSGTDFVGTFSDGSGDGSIHLVSPDGRTVEGEWKRARGPDAGRSGRISGTFTGPSDGSSGPGAGPGTAGAGTAGTGGLPMPPTGSADPTSGPGQTGSRPPLRPIPASLQGLTLQAPELRVTPGQELVVPIWMLNAADVTNMNWELRFDPAVVSAPTTAGSIGKGNLLADAFEANPAAPGVARLGFAQKQGITGTGTVSVHRMKVVGAVGSRTPLTLAVSMITDSRPRALPIAVLHGFVEVIAPGSGTPGSGTGQPPTLQDAYNALKMSVGLTPTRLELDMDRDSKVTSLDAWLIMTTVFLTMKGGK